MSHPLLREQTVHILDGKRRTGSLSLPPGILPSVGVPLISCLTISGNAPHLLPAAIACFQAQSYPNREMIVVCEGEETASAGIVRQEGDPRIRLAPAAKGFSLGALRNLSVEEARGELIAQWDEDDLSHPHRLARQWRAMQAAEAHGCLLLQEIIWFPREGVAGKSHKHRLCEHTLLAMRSRMPRYPELSRGEDTAAVAGLVNSGRIAALLEPDLYVYIHHGANAFDRKHFAAQMLPQARLPDTRLPAGFQMLAAEMPAQLTLRGLGLEVPPRAE